MLDRSGGALPAAEPDARFPLRLLTGRLRDQWHMMTRTGAVPRLMALCKVRTCTSPLCGGGSTSSRSFTVV